MDAHLADRRILVDNHKDVLLAGDTHGHMPQINYLINVALDNGCDAIVQLGDYGYWEHAPAGGEFLYQTSELVQAAGLKFYWIDGNHDYAEWLIRNYEPGEDGTYEIRPGLFFIPRGYSWEWGGRRWLALGGANSIDRAWREKEYYKRGYKFWWDSEAITEEDVAKCLEQPKADVMVCHDAPSAVDLPLQFHKNGQRGLPVPPEFLLNRQRIQEVVNFHEPDVFYHGHLHISYTDVPYRGGPKVIGLANEGCFERSWSILRSA